VLQLVTLDWWDEALAGDYEDSNLVSDGNSVE